MRILSLFSGIGAFEKALSNMGVPFTLVNYCEIDKYASKAYSIIHNEPESKNLWDITKVDTDGLEDFDLMTWGFPCQDISVAGKGAGIKEGTRSGLYYDGYRILKAKLPKYSIIENVKALVSKKHKESFEMILKDLEDLGYTNYWKVLNAKDYGIPQNRERVFIISIRGEHNSYEFPLPFDNGLRLKDMLEDDVDEKYYISNEKVSKLISSLKDKQIEEGGIKVSRKGEKFESNIDIAGTLLARDYKGFGNQEMNAVAEPNKLIQVGELDIKDNERQRRVYSPDGISPNLLGRQDSAKIIQVGNIVNTGNFDNPQRGRIYSSDGCSPSLNTCSGGGLEPKVLEPCICASRGRNPDNPSDRTTGCPTEQRLEINTKGVSNSITTVQKDNMVLEPKIIQAVGDRGKHSYSIKNHAFTIPANPMSDRGQMVLEPTYRIRKLTPKECFRLQGFDDTDIDKCIKAGISNTQLYKMAGNSIVVNVLEELLDKLLA